MRSAPCASAPSHPLHAMPPRFTRNSDRPRASDRTMVDTEDTRTRLPSFQTRLASSPSADEPHRDGQHVRAQTSRANREALLQTSGLDLEKTLSSPVEAELFFLTSLFIELIDPAGGVLNETGILRQLTSGHRLRISCPEWSLLTIRRCGIPSNVKVHPGPSGRIFDTIDR